MPSWFPLNIYDWGCWARQTIVALAVVQSFRPSRPLPFAIDELKTDVVPEPDLSDPWARAFHTLDQAFHALDKPLRTPDQARRLYRPVKSIRRAALRRCGEWINARQERDGCWGGIQPPWV